jgi:threonine/homoserine/homoserine lactone efflux protein
MLTGIAELLTFAVAIAISPIPIVAVVMILSGAAAQRNALAFLAGWVVTLSVVAAVAYALADAADTATDQGAAEGVAWLRAAAGAGFLLLAARAWRGRPAPGEDPAQPAWMRSLDALTARRAFGVGILMVLANPKNLLLSLAAGSAVAGAGVAGADAVVSLVVFVVVASVVVAGSVAWSLIARERSRARLHRMRDWLVLHNGAVMTVVLVIIGVNLIAESLPVIG